MHKAFQILTKVIQSVSLWLALPWVFFCSRFYILQASGQLSFLRELPPAWVSRLRHNDHGFQPLFAYVCILVTVLVLAKQYLL